MSRWQISIPYRDPSQTLIDAACDARELPAEDRDVTRQIMLSAGIDGMRTLAELLDHLAALTPDGRRRLLEEARQAVGLPSTTDVERHDALAAMRSPAPTPVSCAVVDCTTYPATPGGGYADPGVRRWWCDEHRDLAAPGDFEPREVRMEVTPSGALRELDPGDDERESREWAQREAREQERRADAVAFAAERRAERERDERTDAEEQRGRAYAHYADLLDREPGA